MGEHENEKKVVINQEDIKNIEDFFNHFRMPIPKFLQEQIDVYKQDPGGYTVDKQDRLRAEIAHAIASTDHELLKDDLFKNILKNCSKEWFDTQFDRDLEDVFTGEED